MHKALESAIGLTRRSTSAVDRGVPDATGREEKLHDDCGTLSEFGSCANLAVTIR
jgi:hypothetical protein